MHHVNIFGPAMGGADFMNTVEPLSKDIPGNDDISPLIRAL